MKQGTSHCGAYSVKGILSAYGLDKKGHPKEYHPGWFGRLTGITLGRNYYVRILKSHGLSANIDSAVQLTNQEKIELLKSFLSQNTPVMIRIGNGYLTDEYHPFLGKVVGHWITLWGYADEKKLFYVYDSALPEEYRSKDLPIGDTTRFYKEILRDWSFGMLQPWAWPFVGTANFLYINVEKQ